MQNKLDSSFALTALSISDLASVTGGGGGDGDLVGHLAKRNPKQLQRSTQGASTPAPLTPPGYCPPGTGRTDTQWSAGVGVQLPKIGVNVGGGYSSSRCEYPQ